MTEEKNETVEVKIARIDSNVTHIKKKIDEIKGTQKNHEDRIRDNEKFKNKSIGALAVISILISIVVLIVAAIITGS